MLSHVFAFGMSRSGTTLLTTVLDSHPDVSMGYELLPVGLEDAAQASKQILSCDSVDARACSAELEAAGAKDLGVLVHRADRCLVSPEELAGLLADFSANGRNDLSTFEGRIAISRAIVDVKARKEHTSITGFKLNSPRIGALDTFLEGDAAYVFITRDPRDIWRSHVEKQFDRTVDQVASAWREYLNRFQNFASRNPGRCHLVRYEDLVQSPRETLDALCAAIGLPRDPAMDRFYESKASVLRGGHANSEQLKQDFFTSSIGRWDDLSAADLGVLESTCFEGMEALGYEKATRSGFRFGQKQWARNRSRLEKKRNYYLDEYADLILPAVKAYQPMTWLEATSEPTAGRPDEILLIRHDIDHDIENAVRMATWEAERGIRTTYCVLHTAWYYGRFQDHRLTARSEQMVEACLEIQSLGHEINLHNNTIVAALRTGADPYDLLEEELDFLRGRGLDVRGTSTHGDALAAQLGFQNLELFSETVYPSRGGARTVEHDGNKVTFGTRSMSEFGLTYEGYDLPRDIYLSDSGGRLRAVRDTAGRAGLSRSEMDPAPPYSKIVGILTHPVWWDLEKDSPERRPELSFEGLLRSIGERPRRRRRIWELLGR